MVAFAGPVPHAETISGLNKSKAILMHICYMDDSGEDNVRAFAMLTVPVVHWKAGFEAIRSFRRKIRDSDGIFIRNELHATKFLSGHGYVAKNRVTLERRVEIYFDGIDMIAKLPEVRLFSAIGTNELRLFERMLNRLNVAMKAWDSYAVLVSDEGKDYRKLARQLAAFNPIPSQYGVWAGGDSTKNIVVDRLIDDLFYRKSCESYFVQAVDFCAYALLRSEKQIPSKNALGIHKAFDRLEPICQKQAFGKDPRRLGIIRDK